MEDRLNFFDLLPDELVILILWFVSNIKDLGRISLTCKNLYSKMSEEQQLWKHLCLQWWHEKEFDTTSPWTLEQIFVEIKEKNWHWFARCIGNEHCTKFKWIVDIVEDQHERFLYCGELREGIAFTLKFPSHLSQGYLAVGYYSHGDMQNGSYLSTDGLRISGHFKSGRVDGHAEMKFEKGPFVGETYDGEYINNEKQGYGIYSWKNGSKYEGNFQKDKRFGKGKMSVANGFHFECEWKNDQPLNLEEATHPQVKQSIQEGVCTLSVTSKESDFPQALYTCFHIGNCAWHVGIASVISISIQVVICADGT